MKEIFLNPNVLACILAYLIGAIPFGLLLVKQFAKIDIRQEGSKSIGATNVLRVLKQQNNKMAKKLAIATIALDGLKGFLPVLITKLMGFSFDTQLSVALFAVVGHCFSPYLKFHGGKGVATGAGALLLFLPIELAIALAVWFVVGKVLKISSLASLLAVAALLISMFLLHPDNLSIKAPVCIITFIIVYKHTPNIIRLFKGKESKVI